jgi:hypothetical protein
MRVFSSHLLYSILFFSSLSITLSDTQVEVVGVPRSGHVVLRVSGLVGNPTGQRVCVLDARDHNQTDRREKEGVRGPR